MTVPSGDVRVASLAVTPKVALGAAPNATLVGKGTVNVGFCAVVDDSVTVRRDLAEALDSAGFQSILCATIAEARIALRSQPIALAILDLSCPTVTGWSCSLRFARTSRSGSYRS